MERRVEDIDSSHHSASPDRDQVILASKYLIEGTLNISEYAEVKMASDVTNADVKFALKIYSKMLDGEENTVGIRRARAEIEALTKCIGHPNIVQLIDVVEDET